jgi:hypothetical protein
VSDAVGDVMATQSGDLSIAMGLGYPEHSSHCVLQALLNACMSFFRVLSCVLYRCSTPSLPAGGVPQEQEDAQEFLLFLLDHAGEELLKLRKVGGGCTAIVWHQQRIFYVLSLLYVQLWQ